MHQSVTTSSRRRGIDRLRALGARALAHARSDVASAIERDPAARSPWEVALLYPGVHAVWAHRVSHALWNQGNYAPARTVSQAARFLTGIEIHPAAVLGPRLFIDHGVGVVIGETAEVGADVTIQQGVTLGGTGTHRIKRHPTIGDRVSIGAGAKILGPVTVGHGSKIGANAVLVRSVDLNTTVLSPAPDIAAQDSADSSGTETSPE